MMRDVFVTGGTGFVGAHVVRLLVERGDRVRVLIRSTSNTSLIDRLPVQLRIGDITDFDSVVSAMFGVDQVYHVAADYRLWSSDPSEVYRNNTLGTRNVLGAAKMVGVGRVVYTSTVGCLGIPKDGSPGDETTPVVRDDLIGHYKRSKFDAEQVALGYAREGLDLVVVNPSTPVGPGDIKPTPTGRIVLDYLRGAMPAYVDTGLNLIAVEDVARGHLTASERGRSGEKYILGNRNLTLRRMLEILAEITGRKPPKARLPHSVAIAAALVEHARARILDAPPRFSVEAVRISGKPMYYSARKAVDELSLPQSSIAEALERSVSWFRSHGYVGS